MATISRLLDLGMKPYVLATALEGVIAQRLVRKICEHCREPVESDARALAVLGNGFTPGTLKLFRGNGCEHCHGSGYSGRVGIYEVFLPDEGLRHLISSGASIMEINRAAREVGNTLLIDDARSKVDMGLTTAEEVLRVLGPQ